MCTLYLWNISLFPAFGNIKNVLIWEITHWGDLRFLEFNVSSFIWYEKSYVRKTMEDQFIPPFGNMKNIGKLGLSKFNDFLV